MSNGLPKQIERIAVKARLHSSDAPNHNADLRYMSLDALKLIETIRLQAAALEVYAGTVAGFGDAARQARYDVAKLWEGK